jgi:hypothetical protein
VNTPAVVVATQEILEQGLTLLAGVDLGLYGIKLDEPFSASVGGHYRHVLDHFLCLAAGLVSGTVDYDQRERSRELETNRLYAEHMTQMLAQSMRTLTSDQLDEECQVAYTVGYSGTGKQYIPSTFTRELAFCVSHAVHHFAIIRLICAQLNVATTPELGVAPSTLKYHLAQAAS